VQKGGKWFFFLSEKKRNYNWPFARERAGAKFPEREGHEEKRAFKGARLPRLPPSETFGTANTYYMQSPMQLPVPPETHNGKDDTCPDPPSSR
jgi:hypothetical protein